MAQMDGPEPPRILSRRRAYSGWARIDVIEVELGTADDRRVARLEVKDHGDGAAALPFDPARRVAVFVAQTRGGPLAAGRDATIVEAPAGLVDPGETDPAATARRELAEETGIANARLAPLGPFYSSPGSLTERVHLFLAEVDLAAEPGFGRTTLTPHEDVAVRSIPLAEAWAMLETGGIADMKTAALLMALRLRRPDLFA